MSRDRKILYYYDDKYQIQRISRLRLLTSECGVQYRNTTYAPANHHFSSSSFLFTETFFLSSILWYLLKQFPFALSFISARVDILNFYYVLSILFFYFFVIVVVGILCLRILRPCVTIDFQVFITINLLLIYFVNFEQNINF